MLSIGLQNTGFFYSESTLFKIQECVCMRETGREVKAEEGTAQSTAVIDLSILDSKR